MIKAINSNIGFNNYGGVVRYVPGVPASGFDRDFAPITPTGAYFENYQRGSFDLGSGVTLTTTATVLYDTITIGSGVINPLFLINKGNSTFYFGTNEDTANVGAGTPIGSGESIMLEYDIRKVWGITAAGSTVVSAHGSYATNRNAV